MTALGFLTSMTRWHIPLLGCGKACWQGRVQKKFSGASMVTFGAFTLRSACDVPLASFLMLSTAPASPTTGRYILYTGSPTVSAYEILPFQHINPYRFSVDNFFLPQPVSVWL